MSNFNLEALKAMTLTPETLAEMATEYALPPEGEVAAVVDGNELGELKYTDKNTGLEVVKPKLTIKWSIQDAAVLETLGRDKVIVMQDIIINVNDEGVPDVMNNLELANLGKNVWPGDELSLYDNGFCGRYANVLIRHVTDKQKEGQSPEDCKTRAKVTRVKPFTG